LLSRWADERRGGGAFPARWAGLGEWLALWAGGRERIGHATVGITKTTTVGRSPRAGRTPQPCPSNSETAPSVDATQPAAPHSTAIAALLNPEQGPGPETAQGMRGVKSRGGWRWRAVADSFWNWPNTSSCPEISFGQNYQRRRGVAGITGRMTADRPDLKSRPISQGLEQFRASEEKDPLQSVCRCGVSPPTGFRSQLLQSWGVRGGR